MSLEKQLRAAAVPTNTAAPAHAAVPVVNLKSDFLKFMINFFFDNCRRFNFDFKSRCK